MWEIVTALVAAFTLALILRQFREIRDVPTRFLILMIWLRQVLAAFWEYTFQNLAGGLTIYNFATLASLGLLFMLVDRRFLALRSAVPMLLMIGVMLFSGAVNNGLPRMAQDLIKWAFLVSVAIMTYRAMLIYPMQRVLRALLCGVATPGILQIFAVLLGEWKYSFDSGLVTYVGGYWHEAVFSTMLFTILVISSLVQWKQPAYGALIALGCIIGIYLSTYRTSILGALPLTLVAIAGAALAVTPPRARSAVALGALGMVVSAAFAVLAFNLAPDRFAELGAGITQLELLLKDPRALTEEELRILNGRFRLWVAYFDYYGRGDLVTHIIGYGPNAWDGVMLKYAHNTMVSTLYETGVVGLTTLLAMLTYNLGQALRAPRFGLRLRLIAAHVGFMVLNMATMPFWAIEGMIIYGVLCGATWRAVLGRLEDPGVALSARPRGVAAAA